MPRVAIDFSKTVIYHFVCKDTNVKSEYVGSTTNFNKRKNHHKNDCCYETSNHHLKIYQTIRENGGWDNWDMVPLEEFSCENKTQQVIREQYWFDRLKPDMNSYVAYREGTTIKEKRKAYYEEKYKAYREANADKLKEKKKAYREANADKIKEKKKAYREANADKIKEKRKAYREANADKLKENAEVISEKRKAYREANAEILKEKRSIKHTCECGSVCALYRKAIHERTQKHKDFMIS
jgi:hypothetical protein